MPRPKIRTEFQDYGIGVRKMSFVVGKESFWERSEAAEYIRSLTPGYKPRVPVVKPARPQPKTVKALVVRSPWAGEIASGEKTVENRVWKCNYRGWLAIVAARRPESGADAGRAVCLVKLVDIEGCEGDYEWMLADPIALKQRIEIPGRLGLYDCLSFIPRDLLKRIGL